MYSYMGFARGLACLSALAIGIGAPAARAQDKPAWFVPAAAKPAAPTGAPARARPARALADPAPIASAAGLPDAPADQADAVPQYNLPALAPLPALPKTPPRRAR